MESNFDETKVLRGLNNADTSSFIKNSELKNLIQFKLDKTDFEEADLINIDSIILDGRKINGDINIVDFNDIDFFSNLKKIEIKNLDISKEQMKKIEKLEDVSFKNCKVESLEDIRNIKRISINNSKISDLDQIENFQNMIELEIINIQLENFSFLKKLMNLQILKIKNVKGFSLDKINFPLPIKYLSVEGIEKIEEKLFIENCPNLKILSIDKEKSKEWADELDNLVKKEIKILLNDIYEY